MISITCKSWRAISAPTMKKHLDRIAHIQIADNPGRHEPGTGEINYPFLFQYLDEIRYRGWIGCEYKPRLRQPQKLSDGTSGKRSTSNCRFIAVCEAF